MKTVDSFPSHNIFGTFKTFGAAGPAYQVIRPVRQLDDGDWLVLVRIFETGEEAEYRYTHLLEDPKAA